jgi:DHA1 family tetracycline resistance protein-like MFS transporter
LLGAMFGLGFILGPVLGGLLGGIDLQLPFFVAGGWRSQLAYGFFVLPESLPAERRQPFDCWPRQPGGVAARPGRAEGGRARWSSWSA